MLPSPRVGFFADSFHEVNGQALTSRELVNCAARYNRPMLSVRCGPCWAYSETGHQATLEVQRGWAALAVERDLRYDPLAWRHARAIARAVRRFDPDVIHVTSPGDLGQIGVWLAYRLRLPLVISWHTHLHEYGAARLERLLGVIPAGPRRAVRDLAQRLMERGLLRFYRLGHALLAPNRELVDYLGARTGKPAFLMGRGVDSTLFHPSRRTSHDGVFRLGYVGRLSAEKNVRALAAVERALERAGAVNYRFLIVGDGRDRPWLEANLRRADFTGVLRGEALAQAYANMDLFVFPSKTDSFGNVVAEALTSGVPALVTCHGGPQHQVRNGATGWVAASDADFVEAAVQFALQPQRAAALRAAARLAGAQRSWDEALAPVWHVYRAVCLNTAPAGRPNPWPAPLTGSAA